MLNKPVTSVNAILKTETVYLLCKVRLITIIYTAHGPEYH